MWQILTTGGTLARSADFRQRNFPLLGGCSFRHYLSVRHFGSVFLGWVACSSWIGLRHGTRNNAPHSGRCKKPSQADDNVGASVTRRETASLPLTNPIHQLPRAEHPQGDRQGQMRGEGHRHVEEGRLSFFRRRTTGQAGSEHRSIKSSRNAYTRDTQNLPRGQYDFRFCFQFLRPSIKSFLCIRVSVFLCFRRAFSFSLDGARPGFFIRNQHRRIYFLAAPLPLRRPPSDAW